MKKQFPYTLYDLIPSQQTMYLMVKYSFSKQITQIPTSFTFNVDADFDVLTRALNIEIERNDALRLRFRKVNGELKQYFLPSYKVKSVPYKYFRTEQEQQAFFEADARKPVYFLKDECFRIYFFKNANGTNGIYFNVSHLNMDALGTMIFYFDLVAVYRALHDGEPFPEPLYSYEEYIKEELARLTDEKKMKRHEKFYREYFAEGGAPFYAGVHGPAFLEKTRKKKKDPELRVPAAYNPIYDKCKMVKEHIDTQSAAKIISYCKENSIAPESLFMFGLRCHCSAINYRTEDVFMTATCSKRATVKEKRMSGCLTQPIQIRTIISEDKTFTQGINEYTRVRTQLYRHADYPYIKARDISREMYDYSLIQGPASLMFSWIPVPFELDDYDIKMDLQNYDLGRYFTPLYVICSPDPKDKGFNLSYMYRIKLSNKEQIQALHRNAIKVILAGIENPDITVGELLDMCSE